MSNNTFRNLLGVALWGCLTTFSFAQISQGGKSLFSQGRIDVRNATTETMPSFNVREMLAEDEAKLKSGKEGPYRFGKEFSTALNLTNSGKWNELGNGDRVWLLKVKSPEATSLNFIFSTFSLRGESRLFMYTPSNQNFLGGFTQANNGPDEVLGTAPLPGDEVIFELYEPAVSRGLNRLQIGTVVHGYKSTFAFGDAGNCHININCPIAAKWKDQGESVALIVDGGGVCTGSMVNNELEDGTPYFLTANHCFSNRAPSWVFVFDFEAPACPNPTTAPPFTNSVSGSVLRARSSASDFCLLQLNQRPPASYGVYFNGWDALGNAPDSGVGIHHPAGDLLKISFYRGSSTSFNGNPRSENWLLSWLLQTATEGGSSGSPLYDQNHRVVGQLFGGGSACGNTLTDYYGKFSVSWDRSGATRTNRLRDWLDPLNANNRVMDGYYSECLLPIRPFPITQSFDTTNFLPTGYTVNGANNQFQWGLFSVSGSNNAMRANPSGLNGASSTTRFFVPAFNAKGRNKMRLSFKYAYALPVQNLLNPPRRDSLRLLISTDCGKTYSTIWAKNDTNLITVTGDVANFTPSADQWQSTTLMLDSLAQWNNAIYLAFEAGSNGGGNIYVDSIVIGSEIRPRKPLARMLLANNGGCAPAFVFATDSTQFNATRVLWKAPGAVVDTSSSRNPVFQYNNPGIYPLTLIAYNDFGVDSVRMRRAVVIGNSDSTTLPYAENFNNLTRLPADWLVRNNNTDTTWRISSAGFGGSGRSMRMSNFAGAANGDFAMAFLPRMNLSSIQNGIIEFNYAYIRRSNATDTLLVGYSTDCGASWTSFWKLGGTALATATGNQNFSGFVPTATQWRSASIPIPANVSNLGTVRLALICRSGSGQNLYIDNLGVRDGSCPGRQTPTFDSDCIGGTLNFSTASVPNATYLWTGPGGYLSNQQNPTIPVLDSSYLGTYTLTVSVAGCTPEPVSITVVGKPSPPKPIIVQIGNTLRIRPFSGGTISWSVDGFVQPGYRDTLLPLFGNGLYSTTITFANGCSVSSDPRNFSLVGSVAETVHKDGLVVFPNPAKDFISISNTGSGQFEVRDILGRQIQLGYENTGKGLLLNISGITPGTYFLLLKDALGHNQMLRFVKE